MFIEGIGTSSAQFTNLGAMRAYSLLARTFLARVLGKSSSSFSAAFTTSCICEKDLAIKAAPFSPIPFSPGSPSEASPRIMANNAYLSPGISYFLFIQSISTKS